MNAETQKRCELFIQNRDQVKKAFYWDGGLIHLACSIIFTSKNIAVEEKELAFYKKMLKEKVGVFSNFRSTARSVIVSMIVASKHPKQTLDEGLKVYELLKKQFWSSTYLALAAMIIVQMAEASEYEQLVERTKTIYKKMKENHPFLTGGDDSAYCALMALSSKSDGEMIEEAEQCYRVFHENFHSANAVQSLSHVLALMDGSVEEKTQQTLALFAQLKSAGHKYGTSYELPTLGILAMGEMPITAVINEIDEIDAWLSEQKDFGFFSGISKKHRLMYAGILAQKNEGNLETLEKTAINSTVSVIIAQQAAMLAAIAASSSAGSSATN